MPAHIRLERRKRRCYPRCVVTVRTWLVMDAVLDNRVSVEIESAGESSIIERARSLRERGWMLSAAHPLRGQGPVGWPPPDATLSIALDASDLAFLRTQIDVAVDTAARILESKGLPLQARAEQERSLAGLEAAREELDRLDGVQHDDP